MDFLKTAAKAAQDQVNELKQGAMELAEDLAGVTDSMVKRNAAGNKELEFGEGPLGFRLEGTMVVSIEMGSQAAQLGVEAGDRLCAVAGYAVPEFEPDDDDAEQKAMKLVKKWLKEMPRPSTLTFVPITGEDDDDVGEADMLASATPRDLSEALAAPEGGGAVLPEADGAEKAALGSEGHTADQPDKEDMQALLRLAAEWQQQDQDADAAQPADVQALSAELRHEQEERRQLGSELQRARHARSQALADLNSAKVANQKKVAELQAQLSALREENRKMLLQSSAGEADNFSALEALEAREKVLEEECSRLRQAAEAASQAATEAAAKSDREAEELSARSVAAESRATAAELRIEGLTRELRGFCNAHEAELDLLRGERTELDRKKAKQGEAHTQRIAELEEQSARRLSEVRLEVEEAQRRAQDQEARAQAAEAEASAAALEASTARAEAARAALQARMQADQPLKEIDLLADDCADETPKAEASPASMAREAHPDTMALYERIDMLERRCVGLTKKLNSRPVVFQTPVGNTDTELGDGLRNRPSWELSIVSVVGPRTGAIAVLLYATVDTALRNFTKRLLKRDMFLWIFYAHLIVLYAIVAASFTEITPLSSADIADISLKQGSSLPSAPLAATGSDGSEDIR